MCVSSAVQVFSLKIILAVLFCVHYYQFSKACVDDGQHVIDKCLLANLS